MLNTLLYCNWRSLPQSTKLIIAIWLHIELLPVLFYCLWHLTQWQDVPSQFLCIMYLHRAPLQLVWVTLASVVNTVGAVQVTFNLSTQFFLVVIHMVQALNDHSPKVATHLAAIYWFAVSPEPKDPSPQTPHPTPPPPTHSHIALRYV